MKKYRPRIINYAQRYSKAVIGIGSLLILGCVVGVMLSFFVNLDKLKETADMVNSIANAPDIYVIDKARLFKSAAKGYFLIFLLLFLSGMSFYLIPLAILTVFVEGIKGGLSSALIIRCLGMKGIAFSVINTLAKNFLFAPAFVIFTVISIRQALKARQVKPVKNQKYIYRRIAEFVFIILISVFLGGFESYFISVIN